MITAGQSVVIESMPIERDVVRITHDLVPGSRTSRSSVAAGRPGAISSYGNRDPSRSPATGATIWHPVARTYRPRAAAPPSHDHPTRRGPRGAVPPDGSPHRAWHAEDPARTRLPRGSASRPRRVGSTTLSRRRMSAQIHGSDRPRFSRGIGWQAYRRASGRRR